MRNEADLVGYSPTAVAAGPSSLLQPEELQGRYRGISGVCPVDNADRGCYTPPRYRVEAEPGERLRTMKHVKMVSRMPARAADIPVSTKITFIINIWNAFAPILGAKEPQQ